MRLTDKTIKHGGGCSLKSIHLNFFPRANLYILGQKNIGNVFSLVFYNISPRTQATESTFLFLSIRI